MKLKVDASGEHAVLENAHVRLELIRADGILRERLSAWRDGWHPVLESRPGAGDPDLDLVPVLERCEVASRSASEASLRIEGAHDGRRFLLTVTLGSEDSFIHYSVVEETASTARSRSLMSRYAFAERTIEFCFAPHLRPHPGDVVGQFAFKSPAVIVQSGPKLAALIADVERIDASSSQLVCLEPDMSQHAGQEPILAYGLKDHEPHGLIYFRHRPEMIAETGPGRRTYGYRLFATASAEPRYGYRQIARLLWRLYGAANAAAGRTQVIPMDRYGDYALGYAIPTLWRDLPRDGVECGGMIMGIKFPNDIWFHFFFNHLHTAFGLYRMGLRRDRADLVDKARRIRNLIASAPRRDGAIPAIFSHQIITGIRYDEWIPHAHWVGGSIPYQTQIPRPPDQPAYSTMDGAWTALWMLRWDAELERDPQLVEIAKECGELLLRAQLPSGAVPVWLHKDTLEPLDMLRENPSSAASGLIFAKLFEVTRDDRFLEAARRVAAFIETTCMPQGWTDYECAFDSAGKPMDLTDPYSRQRPQCTFPIYWTAELGKLLYRLTRERRYLDQALRAVDYLVLFQAVWSPPYLTVQGFGSIGIGNGHTGWNDARTGIFAPGIAEFFALTGNPEYLERGVAAMRAPLALMYIPENASVSSVFDKGPLGYADECYAHRGRDARLGPSTFDFSIGYALMAYEELFPAYGAAFVDVEKPHALGIDGCGVGSLSVTDGTVDVVFNDNVGRGRRVELGVAAPADWSGQLRVNGKVVEAGQGVTIRVPIEL